MKYTYELIIIFNDGKEKTVKKSNKNILDIDSFTSKFETKRDLIDYFEKEFNKIINDIEIKYTYIKTDVKTEKNLDIVYAHDVFDTKELIDKYSNYLRKNSNINELRRFVYMLYPKVSVNVKESLLLEIKGDLENEVRKYLNSYRKKRDVYFKLKKDSIKTKTKVENNNLKKDTMEEHVSKFKSDNEDINDALNTKDLDEIFALYDIEELRSVRSKLTDKPLVDGLYRENKGRKK